MWKEVDEARYDEMLGVLPPALWLAKGFLVGEPATHRECSVTKVIRPTYSAFITFNGKFYAGPDLTGPEFRQVDPAIVVTPSKQLFYCFAAGIGGDLITLWGHIEKCSPAEAGRQIADTFGIGNSAPVKTSAPVHSPSVPQNERRAEPTAPKGFDPDAFLSKLTAPEDMPDALTFRAGVYRGHLYIPAVYASGVVAGWWKLEDGKLIAPKQWLPDTSNVVQLKRA